MNSRDLLVAWLFAFGITMVVELVVAGFMLRGVQAQAWRRLTLIAIGQFATHPVVWFVLPDLALPRPLYVMIAETWAWGVEAVLYATACSSLGFRRALWISLVANGASVIVGEVVRAF